MTSPAGTAYTMSALNTLNNHWSWYTTRIEDLHRNTIDIAYKTTGNLIYIDKITASDGRLVSFFYEDEETLHIRLSRIVANDQTWTYRYESVGTLDALNYYYLSEVVRPDGLRWRYRYYPFNSAADAAGNYSMESVTYPYGANITYTYKKVDFDPSDVDGQWDDPTTVVATKTVSGGPADGSSVGPGSSLPGGVWTFDYEPKSSELFLTKDGTRVSGLDKTTVVMPGGRQVYYHYGFSYTGVLGSGILWTTGLLYKQETWNGSCAGTNGPGVECNRVESVYNDWAPRLMSHEDFWHGRGAREGDSYAPQLIGRTHDRDGNGHRTEYEGHDEFGNARRIIEGSNLLNDPDKVTELTYYVDKAKWIVHQAEDETVVGPNGETVSHVDRTIDGQGKVVTEDNNGVVTNYSYTENGDLESVTDARGNTSTFSNYKGGVAQLEQHPESVTLSRVVNDTGTVASQTNGRGDVRGFGYDAMNRLTGITYPRNAPVGIIWDGSGKTLSRGNYQERIELDGFGRPIRTTRSDTASGISIASTVRYDVHSNKVFESYPSSESGVSYAYDILKRITEIQHPDGAHRTYAYDSPEVTETDERGNSTVYLYRAYGAPDKDKVLRQITSPNNLHTLLTYDLLNHLTRVYQGEKDPSDGLIYGYPRKFVYDARFYLTSMEDPETGVTSYGRDALGNMISRQTGSSGVTHYVYDARDRQILADYPGTTPDVETSYDADDHITRTSNGASVIDYRFDENDNLASQTLRIGDTAYALGFAYDSHDFLASLTYPSGRSVDYRPDALGRPTQAAPYVSAVAYHAGGQLAQVRYANGEQTDIGLDARQRIASLTHQGLAELGYEYDLLGNVLGIADPFNPSEDRRFDYDALDRLKSAQGRWGAGTFEYDAFGNLTLMAQGADNHVFEYNGLRLRSVVHNNATRSWYAHDAYGNVRSDTEIAGTGVSGRLIKEQQYVYDDAARLRSVPVQEYVGGVPSFSTHDFDYDAAGHRMRRTTPTGRATDFVYGRTGMLLGEYAGGVHYGKEYVYLGSQLIASPKTNEPPRADAGPDRIVDGGREVTLDGRGSSDPDGLISVYAWRQTAGPAVALSSPAGATTRFTAPRLAAEVRLRFELTVTDRAGESATDEVEVLVQQPPNTDPRADAGPDRTVRGGTTVTLDGTASSDVDGSVAAYAWVQIAGTPADLSDTHSATPSFVAPRLAADELLSFTLTVTDDRGASGTDTVAITVKANQTPIADAGAARWLRGGQPVTLDGGASRDPDGTIASYTWVQTAGTPVTLAGADRATASFSSTPVNTEETLAFTLTVTDDGGASAADSVPVTLLPNAAPRAAAGSDQTVLGGSLVRLDGSGSQDSDGQVVSAVWRQDGGTPVILTGAASAIASFTAPRPAGEEPLRFSLTVTDDSGVSASDTVTITVLANQPPLADAGLDQSVSPGSLVGLHGEGSSDPEGGPLRYRWQQTEGVPVSLTGGDTATPSFTVPSPAADEILGFTLTVTDDEGEEASDIVRVEIRAAGVTRGPTTRVSVATGGTQANNASYDLAISADGRYVAFSSFADNLVSGDTNDASDIFVHDRQTAENTRVSVATDGTQANDGSYSPTLSSDGRYVAFSSSASNLASGDTNDWADIFVHDRDTGTTTRITAASDGTPANGWSNEPVLSADGRYIVFESNTSNLVTGDTNDATDIFVHDRETGRTTRVSVTSNGAQGHDYSAAPAISTDGRYVVFASTANNLVIGDTNDAPDSPDIFVHDRQTAKTTRVSVASNGTQANDASYCPAISADGRYVAFDSVANNLVSGDTNNALDIFLHDRQTRTTTRVSADHDGTQGDDHSECPVLSADGRYVAFTSLANNLTPVDPNGDFSDVLVHDRQAGITRRTSVSSDGTPANNQSAAPYRSAPALSADGRHVAFYSEADNLVSGDTNQASDIFVHELIDAEANETRRASAGQDRSVTGGTTVTLDGRGSQDPEGRPLSYRWTQTQGPRVPLKNPSAAQPRFTAPYVAVPTAFEFTLTVTDDDGARASDSVLITVEPRANPRDTRPPLTRYSQTATTVGGVPGYRITLRPNETASVYFRVTGVGTLEGGGIPTSDLQVYATRLTLVMSTPGEVTLEYYAIDKAGNVETTQRKMLRRTQ